MVGLFISSGIMLSCGNVSTVPFHSIQQSHIMGPFEMLKCHSSHSKFCKVPNSFDDHMPNIEIFCHLQLRRDTGYPRVNFGVPVPAPVNTVPFSGTGVVFRRSPAVF